MEDIDLERKKIIITGSAAAAGGERVSGTTKRPSKLKAVDSGPQLEVRVRRGGCFVPYLWCDYPILTSRWLAGIAKAPSSAWSVRC